MAFCTKCGENIPGKLCPNCDGASEKDPGNEQTYQKAIPGQSKRKKKWVAGILLSAMIITAGGYLFADHYFASAQVMDRIEEAIEAEDVDAIRGYIAGDGEDLSDEAIGYFAVMMKEGDWLPSFRAEMLNQLDSYEEPSRAYPADFVQMGSQFFLFNHYALTFNDYVIEVGHGLPDGGVELYYNDEWIGEFENEDRLISFERLFPADGAITLRYAGGYGEEETVVEVLDIDDLYGHQVLRYHWDYEGTYIQISSNHSNSYLLVNGQKENLAIYEGLEYGPVDFDEVETIQAYAEGQFELQLSNELAVEPGVASYELTFGEETIGNVPTEDLYNSINLHVHEWVEAYKRQNIGYFTLLTGDYADDYLTRTENNFDEQQDQGWRYQGRIERIDYDAASVEVITAEEDRIEVSIDARLNFRSSFYEIGSDPSDTPLTNSVSEWTYHLVYDEYYGVWLIDGQEELDSWNPEEEYRSEF